MDIQDALRKRLHEIGREQAHVSGEADQIDFMFAQGGDDLAVVSFALEAAGRQDQSGDSARCGAVNSLRAFAIGYDDGDLRVGNPAGGNAVRQGFKVGAASAE